MSIRKLTVADVDAYRSIRLRALANDPDAFGSNLARERAFTDDDWTTRLDGFQGHPGQVFVEAGGDGDAGRGVVGVGLSGAGDAVLWGMWVDPVARGQGVGKRLIDAVKAWAAERSASTITLFVMRSNAAAIGLYERAGFEMQADAGSDAPADCADELRMIFYAAAP